MYGWAFFAVVMMAAMALGLRWRDDGWPPAAPNPREPGTGEPGTARPAGFAVVAGLAVALAAEETVNGQAVKYLNRLSDLLFVMARHCNDHGARDVLWTPGANR